MVIRRNRGSMLSQGMLLDDRYLIGEIIGSGASAQVLRAFDQRTGADVAIKILRASLQAQDADRLDQRFLREAQSMMAIKHPSVIKILGLGFYGETHLPYLVTEFLVGHELEEEIERQGPMSPERALRLGREALVALGEGHQQGIVHKDLKPANLFLTHPGSDKERIVLLDFGIASLTANTGNRITNKGEIFGTPQYLSPEYLMTQEVSPALDVYQMALVLIEMISGVAVVQGLDPFSCIQVHLRGELELPPPLEMSPLGPVFRKATNLDPDQRYLDGASFASALDSIDPQSIPDWSVEAQC